MVILKNFQLNSLVAMTLVAFISFFVFINSLDGEFVSDDRPVIAENARITSVRYLPDYFKTGLWNNTAINVEDQYLYRPLLLVELYLSYRVWGTGPFGYHLENILLHVVNSLLVFLLMRAFFSDASILVPFAGAVIFAVHPVHSEAVSWIVGRNDLLLTGAVVGGLLLYIRYLKTNKAIFLIWAVILSCVAMLLKEVGIVFPALVWGYDMARGDKKNSLQRVAVFTIPIALFMLLRGMALGDSAATLQLSWKGISHVVEFFAAYIKLLLFPWPLAFYFTRPAQGFMNIAGAFTVLFCFAVFVLYARKQKTVLFALGWLLVTLSPPLLVAFNDKPHIMERVLYLPSVGFSIAAAWFIEAGVEKSRVVTAALVIAVVLVFGVLTVEANRDWKDDGVFYTKAIKYNPEYAGAYSGLGAYYERTGNSGKAIEEYLRATRYAVGTELTSLYQNLGMIYGKSGDKKQSLFYYDKLLALSPGDSRAFTGIGNNYWGAGEYRKALDFYLEAFANDKKNYEACYNVAMAYEVLGEPKKAARFYELFISSAPVLEYAASIQQAKSDLLRLRK